ncbi:MAG: glycyl-tRNA synthetase [Candidatus Saccharimonadales bacterium]
MLILIMSEQANQPTLDDITSLCKRRGFIFQGSDIYGGLAGTWDYGPLGVTLKKNLMDLWWKTFVEDRDDMHGVDASILMNKMVWKASGHTETFNDPLVVCEECKARFRADKIDVMEPCENCKKGPNFSNPEEFNMMFKTVVGPKFSSFDRPEPSGLTGSITYLNEEGNPEKEWPIIDTDKELGGAMLYDSRSVSYLRPETAQGIFTNFRNVVDSLYPDIPFGIAQQGKAFRNEISPRDFVFRSREFNQMEIEYFVREENWKESFEHWRMGITEFLKEAGVDTSKIEELEVPEDDLAHYSKRTIDYEFEYPHGKDELLGLAYRTDFDLRNIEKGSGKKMEYRPKDGSEPFVPHVIEPSFGVERLVMAVLVSAYEYDEEHERIVLKLPVHIAPVKYCVSPLLKNKPELVEKAREVYNKLRVNNAVMWDDNGNIGKRYRRQDEIGTPYCVVIDFDTLEDGTVTVRDRDTTQQKRVTIEELLS